MISRWCHTHTHTTMIWRRWRWQQIRCMYLAAGPLQFSYLLLLSGHIHSFMNIQPCCHLTQWRSSHRKHWRLFTLLVTVLQCQQTSSFHWRCPVCSLHWSDYVTWYSTKSTILHKPRPHNCQTFDSLLIPKTQVIYIFLVSLLTDYNYGNKKFNK